MTTPLNRRQFLQTSAAALAVTSLGLTRAHATPLGLPLGIQLYSVRDFLPKDYLGTLKQVAALGYKEVEAAGYYGHSPQEVKDAMNAAGLKLVSAHHSANDLNKDFDNLLAFNKAVGVQYLICSFPAIKDPTRLTPAQSHDIVHAFTMEDFRWNAERFNEWGKKAKAAGIRFGYHNHTMEFAPEDGVVPFDEMIRLTDPSLVTFEMDCGWVVVGGGDPVHYFQKYGGRISMLHVKDFKAATSAPNAGGGSNARPVPTELGRGTLKLPEILAAAKGSAVRHIFIEQEAFDVPWVESLRIDANYLKALPS